MADDQHKETGKKPEGKARYWTAVFYAEQLPEDWEDLISLKLEFPFVYCVHDKDLQKDGEPRKWHVHVLLAYRNTISYKHALSVFKQLGDVKYCERVLNVSNLYKYLIHDTDDCRKKGKYQYDPEERISGNGFDIGNYEQISKSDKRDIRIALIRIIRARKILDFSTLVDYVIDELPPEYFDLVDEKSGFFERYIKGLWQKSQRE